MKLPPKPLRAAVDEHNLQGGRLLYSAEQMKAYGLACAEAMREACSKACDEWAEKFAEQAPLEGNRPYAAKKCAGAIRAIEVER
jgi:hypothetical protein